MSSLVTILKNVTPKQLGLTAALVLLVLALTILGAQQHWGPTLLSPGGWWVMGGLLLLALLGLLGVCLWRLPHWREQRFLTRLHAAQEGAQDDGSAARRVQLQANLQAALRTLSHAPALTRPGVRRRYALPWYVLLGASASGKTTLLQSVAHDVPPLVQPELTSTGATQTCDWWFFNSAIVLDTTGAYASPTSTADGGAQWYHFLHLLRRCRPLQPMNGLLLTIGADTLAVQSEATLRQDAVQFRQRLDEAQRVFGTDFPVYVLVTRCDLIAGFTEFFGSWPAHTSRQVFGYVHADRPPATPGCATVCTALRDRLQHLRLALLNQESLPAAPVRQRIGCFPEEFAALEQPLCAFIDTLFRPNPYQHTPFWRGIFFCSATQQGTPLSALRRVWHFNAQPPAQATATRPYFVHDLLTHILPRDQHLVRVTRAARTRRRLRHLLGMSACLGLLGGLTQAFLSDWRLYAAADPAPCLTEAEPDAEEPRLSEMARCQQIVQRLEEGNRQRPAWSTWLFQRSVRLQHALRRRYVTAYDATVLNPLERRLARQLHTVTDPLPLGFGLIQRLELLTHCLATAVCTPPLAPPLDYARLLAPAAPQPPAPEQVALLQRTDAAYLRWAVVMPEVLQRRQAAYTERLQQWFASTEFAPAQLLHWANTHHPPVTMPALWPGLVLASRHAAVRVEGAYTREAWQQSLRPFLARAAAAAPSLQPRLQAFHTAYRTQYLAQWQQFLQAFPRAEAFWGQPPARRHQLALAMLQVDAPYQRMLEVTVAQVQPFLLAASETPARSGTALAGVAPQAEAALPAWVHVLQQYMTSERRQAYQRATQRLRAAMADDASGSTSLQLAASGFQAGQPGQDATHPVLHAWEIVQQVRQTDASGAAEEAVVGPLLEQPLRLAWHVILRAAGDYLQHRWTAEVLAPLDGLTALARLRALYGPQGTVGAFVERYMRPFLVDNETRPGQVLGQGLALSPALLASVQQARHLQPVLAAQAPQPVAVELPRAPAIDSLTSLRHEATTWQFVCANQTVTLATPASDTAASAATVLWSFETCHDVVLTIVLACDRQCVERAAVVGITVPETPALRLSKHYTGEAGLVRFLQDFSAGTHTFTAADLAVAAPETPGPLPATLLQRYGLRAVRMVCRVNLPPALTTLLAQLSTPLSTRIIN